MRAVETNVLVRFLTAGEAVQFGQAQARCYFVAVCSQRSRNSALYRAGVEASKHAQLATADGSDYAEPLCDLCTFGNVRHFKHKEHVASA